MTPDPNRVVLCVLTHKEESSPRLCLCTKVKIKVDAPVVVVGVVNDDCVPGSGGEAIHPAAGLRISHRALLADFVEASWLYWDCKQMSARRRRPFVAAHGQDAPRRGYGYGFVDLAWVAS